MSELSAVERARFAAWCEAEARSYDKIIPQLAKLPGTEIQIRHFRAEVAALVLVMRRLRETESVG